MMAIDKPSSFSSSSPPPSSVVEQVVKENRKVIVEHLTEVLVVADHIFEHGYFTRADYHAIEDVPGVVDRCNKFLDILTHKGDDKALSLLMDYLREKGECVDGNSSSTSSSSFSILHEKLLLSRDKFSAKHSTFNHNNSNKLVDTSTASTAATGLIDFADFTLSAKALEDICNNVIVKNIKAKRNWATVMSNMNGLQDLQLLTHYESSGENDTLEMKMRLTHKGEPPSDPITYNHTHSTHWVDIVGKCFSLWKERNGNNATFFSLVGIFQHSQLIDIADWLLENKDHIQRARR